MNITLPPIHIPPGTESEAAKLLKSLSTFFQFTGSPSVVSNPAMRTVATGIEHSLTQAAAQIERQAKNPG